MTDIAKQLLLDDGMAIDQRATASRVRNFLKHDFERYLAYAGLNPTDLSVIDNTHLSSPKMDALDLFIIICGIATIVFGAISVIYALFK